VLATPCISLSHLWTRGRAMDGPALRSEEEGPGERGSCSTPARFKAVSSRCRGPSHFSLRGQRKVTKREATPMARPPGILPSGCAGGLRGFPTAHPCTGGKLARIPAGHPSDFPPPARRAIGAPGRAARSRRALRRSRCAAAEVSALGALDSAPLAKHQPCEELTLELSRAAKQRRLKQLDTTFIRPVCGGV